MEVRHVIYDQDAFFEENPTVATILVTDQPFLEIKHIIYDQNAFFKENPTVATILVTD
jgi:hypothetical protein